MVEMNSLVKVENLEKKFPVGAGLFQSTKRFTHAVDGISFDIEAGSSLGLVGESGCGKTTTGKLLSRLYEPTGGHIYINDAEMGLVDLATLSGKRLKEFRSRVQIIFQDPYESLNPRRTIYDTVAEPLAVQGIGNISQREKQVAQLLETVGLTPATSFMFRFPHELSGGQRQRVAIARALVINPSFVVADEPTSMLDVSIRIGVMQLMMELAEKMDVSYLYITHDLAVARYMCQEIAVMYTGKIIEKAETEELLKHPQHPYTRALISAVPVPDPSFTREAIPIKGGVSAPIDPPDRCRFFERCPLADNFCKNNPHPSLEDKGNGHYVACYRV
jgi:oligopeptide/dipeptide ABC transporter ATP-binding protein